MQCQKCGATNKSGAKFCAGCGTPLSQGTSQQITHTILKTVSTSGLRNFVVKNGKKLTVLLSVLSIAPMVFILGRNELDSYLGTALLLLFAAIFLTICLEVFSFKNRKKEIVYCPRCKKKTQFNKYMVCKECHLDLTGGNLITLLSMIFAVALCFIAYAIDMASSRNWLPTEGFYAMCGAIAFAAVPLLYPIYMYPAILARRTEHVAATAIYVLNFLFGFTIIFWVVLLIWASSGNGNQKTVVVQNASPQKTAQDAFAEIQKLREAGMITDEEFETKRQEILSRL